MQWRSIIQEGIDGLLKDLCGTMQKEVLEKYKLVIDVVSPWTVGFSRSRKSINLECGEKTVGPEFSLGSENTVFSESRIFRQEERKKVKSCSNRECHSWHE